MVVLDATFSMLLVDPSAAPPLDASTGAPITHARQRIDYLLQDLNKSGERVVIPAPALAEVLVGAEGTIADLVDVLSSSYRLKVAPFDQLAAIEVALMTDASRRGGGVINDETKAKVKYDRQIIAIAKVLGADAIYTDDTGLKAKATGIGIHVIGLAEVALPPEEAQIPIVLSLPEDVVDGED